MLKTPRTRIAEALRRPEAEYTGVYILLGDAEGQPQAYIGEAEDLRARIRGHVAKKDWWETAVLITSAANNLHKAHIKYLESRLVELALEAKRMPLENGNAPTRSSLSEAGVANMESFLDTLMMVLPAIQVDMFVNKAKPASTKSQTSEASDLPVFELKTPKHRLTATAIKDGGEMVIQAGSKARKTWTQDPHSKYNKIRGELLNAGVLKHEGDFCIFQQNYAFSSVSTAAAVVQGRAANGKDWKLKGTNKTYADWEAEQLEKDD
ncbi:MAG: GIY-YIG nuclease family protein [Rhodobacteraceae bacterium]|nr:GIY-YIG nuclease family protein [Paracoccaceae bacterium]